MRDNRWALSTWWILTTSEGSGRDPTASSTQDAPGSIDIEWIPDGGSGFTGLSARGLDDEDIYDTLLQPR